MEVVCEGLFPMDFGDTTFTSFEASTAYLDAFDQFPQVDPIKKEENSPWFLGKIHSHHNMDAFHSGTDTTDLYENAPKLPFFLSLVVNYNCRPFAEIAVNAETTEKTIVNTKWKLKGFKGSGKNNKVTAVVSPTCLIIPCETVYETDTWLGNRIIEIENDQKAAAEAKKTIVTTNTHNYKAAHNNYNNYKQDDVDQKVYAKTLGNLTDLITFGAMKEGAAYYTMMELSKHITASKKQAYINRFGKYFADEWYPTNFYNVPGATATEAIRCIQKFLSFHPSSWINTVIKDATDQLKRNLSNVQQVQRPSMVPTYSRE